MKIAGDFGNQSGRVFRCMVEAAPVHDIGHRALANFSVWSMVALAQRINHRIFKMSTPPPGNEPTRVAIPALSQQKRCNGLGQSTLHVDDGAVLVEHQRLDLALPHLGGSIGLAGGISHASACRAGGDVAGLR